MIRYRDVGAGPTLLFVHGLLVNRELWADMIPHLSSRYRCVVPDLPLGAHAVAMAADVELTPSSVAGMLNDLMVALDLHQVTLIGNDTGGAICQLVIASHGDRIDRLVLSNCDAYDAFFPRPLQPFHHGARLLGQRFGGLLARVFRYRTTQRALLWTVAKRRVDDARLDASFGPLLDDRRVRGDLVRFLSSVSNRYTLDAARSFPRFDRPVLLVWGTGDFFFSARLARRMATDFPDARLEWVADSRAFVPIDQPAAFVRHISDFVPSGGT